MRFHRSPRSPRDLLSSVGAAGIEPAMFFAPSEVPYH